MNAAFIQSLMAKAKWGATTVGGFTSASFSTMSTKLDSVVNGMRQLNSTYTVNGIPQPDAFEAEVKHAMSARTVSEALHWGQKFVDEHYKYVTFPGIDVMGKAGGDYGFILKDYFNTKEQYTKSFGDMGGNIGGAVAGMLAQQFLFGAVKRQVFSWGARMLAGAAAVEGAGLAADATIAGLPAGIVLNILGGLLALGGVAVSTFEGQRLGRSAAETAVKATGLDRENAGKAAANDILTLVPKLTEMWTPIALTLNEGPNGGTTKGMFTQLDQIASKNYGGTSLKALGLGGYKEVAETLGTVARNINVPGSNRGEYVNLINKVRSISGTDITSTLSSISTDIAPTAGNTNRSIDFTAQIFNEFFLVATKGGVATTNSAIGVAQSLTDIASEFSKRNMLNKNVSQQVAGVQKFTQKYVQGKDQVSAESTGTFMGIMDTITKSAATSPLASNLLISSGISRGDAVRGANKPGQMGDLLNTMSNRWHLGAGTTNIDSTTGAITWDKSANSEVNFANFINAATGDTESGGLGLSVDDAMLLGKYLIAYEKHPGEFESLQKELSKSFDGDSTGAVDKSLGSPVIAMDALTTSLQSNVKLGNLYNKIAGNFVPTFVKIGDGLMAHQLTINDQVVTGMGNLLHKILELQKHGTGSGQAIAIPGVPSTDGASNLSPTGAITSYGKFSGQINATSSGVTSGLSKGLYDQAFLDRVTVMAQHLNVDPNWLMAIMAHESWGTFQTGHIRGSTAVGLIQFTDVAIKDLNSRGANLNKEKLAAMSNTEQLEWVEAYLKLQLSYRGKGAKINNAGDLYALVFTPAAFGKAASEIIYSQASADADLRRKYAANHGLDKNNDGNITVGEMNAGMLDAHGNPYMEGTSYDRVSESLPELVGAPGNKQVAMTAGPMMGAPWREVSGYNGRIIRGTDGNSHLSSTATLAHMKGTQTKIGQSSASWAETALVNQSIAGDSYLRGYCATFAGFALNKAGFKNRATGSADVQLGGWMSGSHGAVAMSIEEVMQTGGFEPGDLIYVRGGNHVGVVSFDGSVIQSGFAYDAQRNTHLLRTDITSFTYEGVNNMVIVRPGMDSNNDGFISQDEHNASARGRAVPPKLPTNKVLQGKKALINSQDGNFTIKGATGSKLTPLQIKRIEAKERYIEKTLGLKDENFSLTEENGTLRVKINVGSHDPSAIAKLLLKEIDSFI
jgi:hypothetical protein